MNKIAHISRSSNDIDHVIPISLTRNVELTVLIGSASLKNIDEDIRLLLNYYSIDVLYLWKRYAFFDRVVSRIIRLLYNLSYSSVNPRIVDWFRVKLESIGKTLDVKNVQNIADKLVMLNVQEIWVDYSSEMLIQRLKEMTPFVWISFPHSFSMIRGYSNDEFIKFPSDDYRFLTNFDKVLVYNGDYVHEALRELSGISFEVIDCKRFDEQYVQSYPQRVLNDHGDLLFVMSKIVGHVDIFEFERVLKFLVGKGYKIDVVPHPRNYRVKAVERIRKLRGITVLKNINTSAIVHNYRAVLGWGSSVLLHPLNLGVPVVVCTWFFYMDTKLVEDERVIVLRSREELINYFTIC